MPTIHNWMRNNVFDGLLHAEQVENKRLKTPLLDKLVKDKKSIFEPFYKARLITGNQNLKKKREVFQTFISRKGGLTNSWFTC